MDEKNKHDVLDTSNGILFSLIKKGNCDESYNGMAPEDLILLSEISQSQKNISMVWFQ
jgi:hypothetical protein